MLVIKVVASNLQSTDGLTVLARIEIVTILVRLSTIIKHFMHKMKPIDPLLLADVTFVGCIV